MMKSNANTTSILSNINKILGIEDSYQAPERVLNIVTAEDHAERDAIYHQLAELFEHDYTKDWFWEYFQEEHADRHQNKQDFTPPCIAGIIHEVIKAGMVGEQPRITYEPAAGTGQMLIRDWHLTRRKQMPWEYNPIDHLIVCSELSVKTIPFLLLNLSIRGICGIVLHMNTMTKEIFEAYVLVNPTNHPGGYSDVVLWEKKGDAA